MSDFQSSFRQPYSTGIYLSYLTSEKETIEKETDNGNYCGMAMLDLQNAFDPVNHQILEYQLKIVGFNKDALKWLQSYFSGAVQMVDVGDMLSQSKNLTCGVPQGSTLELLLFFVVHK